jgi:N-acetylated-alpha-linked acidic dipeptidase
MAETYETYMEEIGSLWTARRDEAVERNRQLDEGAFAAIRDPREPELPPARADLPPHLNLAPLGNALGALRQSADRYEAVLAGANLGGAGVDEANRVLRQVEPALTSPDGLPRRPWFRHLVYAPGLYTGYGVKTLPGVREAIEQGYWKEAEEQAARLAERLRAAAELIDQAARALGGVNRPG